MLPDCDQLEGTAMRKTLGEKVVMKLRTRAYLSLGFCALDFIVSLYTLITVLLDGGLLENF